MPQHSTSPPSIHTTNFSVQSLMKSFNNTLIRQHTNHWNFQLESLSVQSKHHLLEEATLYADLPSLRASENPPLTVPVSLVPTTAKPDIVIIQGKDVQLLELTVPINTKDSLQAAHERKQTKPNYIAFINDLEAIGVLS